MRSENRESCFNCKYMHSHGDRVFFCGLSNEDMTIQRAFYTKCEHYEHDGIEVESVAKLARHKELNGGK